MNKKIIYIIITAVIITVGLWLWMNQPVSNAPTSQTPQKDDTTGKINHDLNNITVEDPDFKNIDSDLKSL